MYYIYMFLQNVQVDDMSAYYQSLHFKSVLQNIILSCVAYPNLKKVVAILVRSCKNDMIYSVSKNQKYHAVPTGTSKLSHEF